MTPPILMPPRRALLQGAGALALTGAFGQVRSARAAAPTQLAISLRSLTNPYHAHFADGGKQFAKAAGLPIEVLVTEGNSEKGIQDVSALLDRTGGNMCLCIDPNDSPDAGVIVQKCVAAKAQVVTIWNKPADLHPWDHDPYYVAHISFDGVQYGRLMAEKLIEAMGGAGGIVALGGIFNNVPAIERRAGMEQAVAATGGKVKILDFQVADWLLPKAFKITQAWITRFGGDIKGIWAANDEMALGAVQALREEGSAGKIPVSGIDGTPPAIAAVKAGTMVGTVDWDPVWIGGMGLSIAYATRTGKIDLAKEPHGHREFYGTGVPVTKDNVAQYLAAQKIPKKLDWNDHWGRVQGQIRAS